MKTKKVIANHSTRRAVARRVEKTGNAIALPMNLEKARVDCLACFKGGKLPPPAKAGVTCLGHKCPSKAGAIDVVIIAALSGNYDVAGLLSALIEADNKYGRKDTPDALDKRIRDHCAMKRNGTCYLGGRVHLTRPHNLTADQAKAIGRFAALLSVPLRTALKQSPKK